jgi:hypothetical protein
MQLTERKMAWWHSVPVDGHGEDGSNARLNIVHRREREGVERALSGGAMKSIERREAWW